MTDICSTCCVAPPTQVPSSARPSSVESRRRPRGPSRSGGSLLSSVLLGRAGGVVRFRGSALRRHAGFLLTLWGWVTAGPRPLLRARAAASRSLQASVRNDSCATCYMAAVCASPRCETALSYFFCARPPRVSAPVEDRKRSRGVPWTAPPKMSPGAAC